MLRVTSAKNPRLLANTNVSCPSVIFSESIFSCISRVYSEDNDKPNATVLQETTNIIIIVISLAGDKKNPC